MMKLKHTSMQGTYLPVKHFDTFMALRSTRSIRQEQHDQRLDTVLERISKAGLTVNANKCGFALSSVHFLGQLLDANGIRPDPEKIKAVHAMQRPTNVTELRHFLGMANQLAKFTSSMADITKPLRDLLSTTNAWLWGQSQQEAFEKVKKVLSTAPTLAL